MLGESKFDVVVKKKKKKFDVYQNSHVNLLKYLVKLTQKTLLFLV